MLHLSTEKIDNKKKLSQRDAMLFDQLQQKLLQTETCKFEKLHKAREAMPAVDPKAISNGR
jgi:hypothetical protein